MFDSKPIIVEFSNCTKIMIYVVALIGYCTSVSALINGFPGAQHQGIPGYQVAGIQSAQDLGEFSNLSELARLPRHVPAEIKKQLHDIKETAKWDVEVEGGDNAEDTSTLPSIAMREGMIQAPPNCLNKTQMDAAGVCREVDTSSWHS